VALGDPSIAIKPERHVALRNVWGSLAAPAPRTNPSATWRWGGLGRASTLGSWQKT